MYALLHHRVGLPYAKKVLTIIRKKLERSIFDDGARLGGDTAIRSGLQRKLTGREGLASWGPERRTSEGGEGTTCTTVNSGGEKQTS